MLQRVIPLCFLLGGLALIVDYVAPPRRQTSVVESLSTRIDMEGETVYEIGISGGPLARCHLDSDAYARLRKGDRIEIDAGHLFDSCTRVVRDGETLFRTRAQPLVALIVGALLCFLGAMVVFGRFVRRANA
jgi:hypothetical protein